MDNSWLPNQLFVINYFNFFIQFLLISQILCCSSSSFSSKVSSSFPKDSAIISSSSDVVSDSCDVVPQGNLQFLYTTVKPEIQEKATKDLIQRTLPLRHNEFDVKIDPSLTSSVFQDAFSIDYNNDTNQVIIAGTTGVAASFGFHHYLKYNCHCHIAWESSQLNLPSPLPKISMRKNILDRFRFFQNPVTESYSFVWWRWPEWEKQIDWLALNGFNLALASVGQEAIWQKVFLDLGLTSQEIDAYFTGPAFLAFWRMGNLQQWAGPISQYYISEKLTLLHQIVARMRAFGMLPVLPAFAGSVPISLRRLYPNSTFTHHQSWSNFNSTYMSYYLDPADELFIEIGKRFNSEMRKEVGSNHIYSCDTFNEMRPSKNDTSYLRAIAQATFHSMSAGDPQAVWLMQAWLFNYDRAFWTLDNVKSYLGGIDVGNLILIDVQAEVNPSYIRFDSFYNHSFIWCIVQNFGGATVLFGNMELINVGVPAARNASAPCAMIGIGVDSEGINQNYVIYDFMTERTLISSTTDCSNWVAQYSQRRYGMHSELLEKSWKILESGVYNAFPWSRSNAHTILSGRPGLNRTESHWYNMADIGKVLDNFLTAASEPNSTISASPLFRHDLLDFTRQFLQHTIELLYVQLLKAYYSENVTMFEEQSEQLLEALDDLDTILSTNTYFMGGTWVKAAESWGQNETERDLLRFNSLNQITLWGPTGEILDYAAKQWSGKKRKTTNLPSAQGNAFNEARCSNPQLRLKLPSLLTLAHLGIISLYNKPRWLLFIQMLKKSLIGKKPFGTKAYNRRVFKDVEVQFTLTPSSYFPVEPKGTGDTLAEATRIYKKWKRIFHYCLRHPFKYERRRRGRGQQLIPKKAYAHIRKKGKNKAFAHFYAKSIGLPIIHL